MPSYFGDIVVKDHWLDSFARTAPIGVVYYTGKKFSVIDFEVFLPLDVKPAPISIREYFFRDYREWLSSWPHHLPLLYLQNPG